MHDLSSYVEQGGLGGGGFADVFRAVHIATKEVVALKKSRSDEEAKARTRREIEIQGLRLHGNIMPVLDSADDGSWFTMPLATGDLGRVHDRHPLRDADVLRLVEDCAAALGVAHRNGYVHRDLSPPNILWMGDRWVVADWGCVKMPDGKHRKALTRARTAMGTVPWAAPEALEDGREVDARADIFSLGRIVGWLVSGKVPEPNKESSIDGTSPWRKFVIETTRADVDERPGARSGHAPPESSERRGSAGRVRRRSSRGARQRSRQDTARPGAAVRASERVALRPATGTAPEPFAERC